MWKVKVDEELNVKILMQVLGNEETFNVHYSSKLFTYLLISDKIYLHYGYTYGLGRNYFILYNYVYSG